MAGFEDALARARQQAAAADLEKKKQAQVAKELREKESLLEEKRRVELANQQIEASQDAEWIALETIFEGDDFRDAMWTYLNMISYYHNPIEVESSVQTGNIERILTGRKIKVVKYHRKAGFSDIIYGTDKDPISRVISFNISNGGYHKYDYFISCWIEISLSMSPSGPNISIHFTSDDDSSAAEGRSNYMASYSGPLEGFYSRIAEIVVEVGNDNIRGYLLGSGKNRFQK